MRAPDFTIGAPGDPYLRRWWVIPRNRWFNIYLHQILRSDDDRALHDHPWINASLILRGGVFIRRPGSITLRRSVAAHRLEIGAHAAWTLFITGPRVREWGFHCPNGWVHWERFTATGDSSRVGQGCG